MQRYLKYLLQNQVLSSLPQVPTALRQMCCFPSDHFTVVAISHRWSFHSGGQFTSMANSHRWPIHIDGQFTSMAISQRWSIHIDGHFTAVVNSHRWPFHSGVVADGHVFLSPHDSLSLVPLNLLSDWKSITNSFLLYAFLPPSTEQLPRWLIIDHIRAC